MTNFADRLIDAIHAKGNPCVVGLDPRIDQMPAFIIERATQKATGEESVFCAITEYHRKIIQSLGGLVPAVKLQIAFYEQYGLGGIRAFIETINEAKSHGLLVIADAKRNDISSTAEAYANAFLGAANPFGTRQPAFDADCMTVSPYLGADSIEPFVKVCREYGKGIFILVKTSNPGSGDFQDLEAGQNGDARPLYIRVADMVDRLGEQSIGTHGYSAIGAVVGATYPKEADLLRKRMPRSILLVPGYGAQGGTAEDAGHCFDSNGLGAIVNASRGITYGLPSKKIGPSEFDTLIRDRTLSMCADIRAAIQARKK